MEGILERGEETGLQQHVVVEQADVRAAGQSDAAVDGAGEGERGGGVDDLDLRVVACQPLGGAVGAAVIHHDDLLGSLREEIWELGLQQVFARARRDDHGNASGISLRLVHPSEARTPLRPQHSRDPGSAVLPQQAPVGFAGGADAPSQHVGGPPRHVPRDGGNRPRPQHEVIEVFVEGEEAARGEDQRQQSHAAEWDVGDQHDAGQADGLAAQLFAAVAQVLGERAVDAVADPLEFGIFGRKIGDHPKGQFGIEGAQVLDETPVEGVGAAGEGELDLRVQRQISRWRCAWAPPARLVSHSSRA